MLFKFGIRKLALIGCLVGLAPTVTAHGDEAYHPESSVFNNVGYSYNRTLQPEVPTPIVDAEQEPAPVEHAAPAAEPVAEATSAPCNSCAGACTCKKKADLKKAAASAHKGLFYANDFSYLNDPCYNGCLCGDAFKELQHGCFKFDVGGQVRLRYHNEENHRGLGFTGRSDDFTLSRTRLYFDAQLGENVRFYAETLDANSSGENFNPRPIEENRWDIQNLFFDLTLLQDCDCKLVARAGRQEILLGNQRYVSPLDWANTRRTFDGGRMTYTNSNWTVDGFWLAPLVRDRDDIDDANYDVAFYGIYATTKAAKNGTLDYYWLALDNDVVGFRFDSLGSRYNGKIGSMLFEAEAAYQFGTNANDSDHNAGFFTIGAGKANECHKWKPTTWVYIDWASGGDLQGAGNGHDHFFPLAHKYNGFMDLFGRRNLIDFNILNTLQLTKKVKFLTWFHAFWLENDNDTPYNVNMSAFAPGITPGDDELGQEIDFLMSIGITERSNLVLGYSHFWAGDYYDTPGLPFNGDDADFFYAQWLRNF